MLIAFDFSEVWHWTKLSPLPVILIKLLLLAKILASWHYIYIYSIHKGVLTSQMFSSTNGEAKTRERSWMSFHMFLFTPTIAQECISSPLCQNCHRFFNWSAFHEPSLSSGWFADAAHNLNQMYALSWYRIMLLMNCMELWIVISSCNLLL